MNQRLADCANPGDCWKAVKDILHMNNTSSDTQSDHDNNLHMCNSFIDYFKSKIVSIHNTIIGKLSILSTPPPDCAHFGPTLDAPSPVSPKQVLAILNPIPAKSSPLNFVPTSLLKSCFPAYFPTSTLAPILTPFNPPTDLIIPLKLHSLLLLTTSSTQLVCYSPGIP